MKCLSLKIKAHHQSWGITNFTFIKRSFVLGSDAGPANALMDIYCQKVLKKKFDKGGLIAAKGDIHASSVNEMSKHSFFKKNYQSLLVKKSLI